MTHHTETDDSSTHTSTATHQLMMTTTQLKYTEQQSASDVLQPGPAGTRADIEINSAKWAVSCHAEPTNQQARHKLSKATFRLQHFQILSFAQQKLGCLTGFVHMRLVHYTG